MIHAGWILEALGWQAVGAGMAAKKGINAIQAGNETRRQRQYMSPMREWWDKYGLSPEFSEAEFDRFYYKLDLPTLRRVSEVLRANIEPTTFFTRRIYENGGVGIHESKQALVLYYALQGKALQFKNIAEWNTYPMACFFDNPLDEECKDLVVKFMTERGVPDVHWYVSNVQERQRLLAQANR